MKEADIKYMITAKELAQIRIVPPPIEDALKEALERIQINNQKQVTILITVKG